MSRSLTAPNRTRVWARAANLFAAAAAIVGLALGANIIISRVDTVSPDTIGAIPGSTADPSARGTLRSNPRATTPPPPQASPVPSGLRSPSAPGSFGAPAHAPGTLPLRGPTGSCGLEPSPDPQEVGAVSLTVTGPGTLDVGIALEEGTPGAVYEAWLVELEPSVDDPCVRGTSQHLGSLSPADDGKATLQARSEGWVAGEHTFQVILLPASEGDLQSESAFVSDSKTFILS